MTDPQQAEDDAEMMTPKVEAPKQEVVPAPKPADSGDRPA
jgi:hypothetical protein